MAFTELELEHLKGGVNERVSPFKSFTGSFLSQLNLFCHQNTLSIIFDAQRPYILSVFLKLCFHSSVALIYSNTWQLVSRKKRKGNKTQSLLVLYQDALWKLRRDHTHTSESPCYHDAIPKQAFTEFQRWEIVTRNMPQKGAL